MTGAFILLAFVTLQRLGELVWARANTRRLLAMGGYEVGAGHYPLIVLVHGAWLAGLWWLAPGTEISAFFVVSYLALQLLRVWVLVALGRRWTTRIIVVPGETLVVGGPYRFVRHPNYWVVAGEIACLPLAFGLVGYAVTFSILNLILLRVRIPAESAALTSLQ